MKQLIFVFMLICFISLPAMSFPEFQAFVEKHSGRPTNCSMCHVNDQGPVGDDVGQIGSFNQSELGRLNKARMAFAPGSGVDNPSLNEFGNELVKKIGVRRLIFDRSDPIQIYFDLGQKSDLDGDGICDAQEYLDGTDTLNKFHGDPAKLFWINLRLHACEIIFAAFGIGLLLYGLKEVLSGCTLKEHE